MRISIRFRWPRRRRQSKWGAPDPGPRSSDDQGIYLACLPAQNIRPSHCTVPRRGLPRAALAAGTCINASHVTRSPDPTGPACSHDQCASKTISARLHLSRLANGRWPISFREAGLRGRRNRRWPGGAARGNICIHVGVSTNAHRLCRVLLALEPLPVTRNPPAKDP